MSFHLHVICILQWPFALTGGCARKRPGGLCSLSLPFCALSGVGLVGGVGDGWRNNVLALAHTYWMLRDKKFFWSSFQLRATLYLSFFLSFLSSFASHLISSHLILSYPILSYPSIYLSIYLTWCYVIKTSIELMIRHKKSSCSSTTASSYVVYIYIYTYIYYLMLRRKNFSCTSTTTSSYVIYVHGPLSIFSI